MMNNKDSLTPFNIDDSELNLVIRLMRHPQKDNARKLLWVINKVMNYYIPRQDDEVRYPIVYIPASEPWAQEVCIEFITLKISLLYNNLTKRRLDTEIGSHDCIFLPEKCSQKKYKELSSVYRYKKEIYRLIKDTQISTFNSNKNLIVCHSFDVSTPHNPFLPALCGEPKTITDKSWAISRIGTDINNKSNQLNKLKSKTFKEISLKFENLFVLLSRSANGRFSDTYSLQRPYVERLNKLGAGIKNVFYFYFSTKPYKLQRLLSWKLKNAGDILQKDVKEMQDFISLTSIESDNVFGRKSKLTNFIINLEDDNEFKMLVGEALDSCRYSVQVRNTLAICFDDYSQKMFKSEYQNIIDDINEPYFDIFFKMIQDMWKEKILPKIWEFLDDQVEVSFVLDDFVPNGYKAHLVSFFKSQGVCAHITSVKSLKYMRTENAYISKNPYKKIVLLSFYGHYVGRPYSFYPNSFDPIFLNKKQEILNVINTLVFDPYYAIHNFEYLKTLRNTLSSDFRNNCMRDTISLPKCPKRKIDDSRDQSVLHNERRSQIYQNCKRYSASIGNGKTIKLADSEYIICKENASFSTEQILSVSTLNTLIEKTGQSFLISPLTKIQDTLDIFLKQKENYIKESELYIRQDPRYGFTYEEILSHSEVWKILLRRKVEQKGADVVYSEIMEKLPYSERINRHYFECWYAPNNDMILPRSRRMQDILFQYLSIATPYEKIIRRKKAQRSTNTEQKNLLLRSFLCNYLFTDNYEESFDQLSDNVKDVLSLDTPGDFKALIELLKENIEYIELKSLTQ